MGGEGMKGGGEEVIAILKLNAMHTYNDIACLLWNIKQASFLYTQMHFVYNVNITRYWS